MIQRPRAFPKYPPVLKGVHRVVLPLLEKRGFRFETRRAGDLKLGLWRKRLASGVTPANPTHTPRRLVIVPGFGDTPLSWIHLLAYLRPITRAHFDEIVLLDFPGFHGLLSDEKAIPSMDLLLSASHDIFDSLQPHTLLGHSLGGWIASSYAADCGTGERPKNSSGRFTGPSRLILMDPAGVLADNAKAEAWRQLFAEARLHGWERFRPHVFAREPFHFRFLAPCLSGFFQKPEICQFMDSTREDHLMNEKLSRIRIPVWLVWGERDTLTPTRWMADWLDRLDPAVNARAVIVRRAGHSPQVEAPAMTAALLARIFAGRGLSRPQPLISGLAWKVVR